MAGIALGFYPFYRALDGADLIAHPPIHLSAATCKLHIRGLWASMDQSFSELQEGMMVATKILPICTMLRKWN